MTTLEDVKSTTNNQRAELKALRPLIFGFWLVVGVLLAARFALGLSL
jgi:hypothetical protein